MVDFPIAMLDYRRVTLRKKLPVFQLADVISSPYITVLKGVGLVENRTAKCIFDGLGGEMGAGGQQRPNLLRPCHAKYIKIRGLQKPSPRPS